jgi:hypothetical protein
VNDLTILLWLENNIKKKQDEMQSLERVNLASHIRFIEIQISVLRELMDQVRKGKHKHGP